MEAIQVEKGSFSLNSSPSRPFWSTLTLLLTPTHCLLSQDRRKLEELANSDRAAGEALKRVQASDPFATGSTRRD